MSKLSGVNFVLVLATCAIAIASLVFAILINKKVNEVTDPLPSSTTESPLVVPIDKPGCKVSGDISDADGWTAVSANLRRGINRGYDPCLDFYQYSCDSFLSDGTDSTSPSGDSQKKINLQIADFLDKVTEKSTKVYEKIAKKAYQLCSSSMIGYSSDRVREVQQDLVDFVQFPLFGVPLKDNSSEALLAKIGRVERQFLTSILFGSGASVDYKNNSKTAIYVDQAGLPYPRDYYVLPKFIDQLQAYAQQLRELLEEYSAILGKQATCNHFAHSSDCIKEFAEWVVDLEVQIALSSWDSSEMRNYKQQYNPFNINTIDEFSPKLHLSSYVRSLTEGMLPEEEDNNIIIGQPSYFTWLDGLLNSDAVSVEQLTNYLALTFLVDTSDYTYLGALGRKDRRLKRGPDTPPVGLDAVHPAGVRKGRGARKLSYKPSVTAAAAAADAPDSVRNYCVEMLLVYLPYAPGYIYVKELRTADRYAVRDDVSNQTARIVAAFSNMIDSLDWMKEADKQAAHAKSEQLLQNIGWPAWFEPFDETSDATVDQYHEDYLGILNATTYWEASKVMKYGMETREFWRMLGMTNAAEIRSNFLQSPAMVNAWYQPERNSITFPLANMAPPYYSLDFPQAYNYAGQGGTSGHELTHGYDDEGVQFGPDGMLADCKYTHCSILHDDSRQGFSDMAQCVVQQYNLQCCPVTTGNVRCANGANTQGENIADIGGLQAAYRAYQTYVQEERGGNAEELVPGLEDLTMNQVFWLSYGYSWCSKQSQASLVSQLETNVHAPSACRVNQVMQDIPQFGRDFGCKRGSELYPDDDDRCKVWVGF